MSDRFLPDKAVDLIDEAGSRLRIRRMTAPPDLREFDDEIADVRPQEESIDSQDFEAARRCAMGGSSSPSRREKQWKAGDMDVVAEVDEELIAEVLAVATGIPIDEALRGGVHAAARMEERAPQAGHRPGGRQGSLPGDRHARAGLKDPKRPGGSFIFAGPSGVGRRGCPRRSRSSSSATRTR